MSLNCESSSLTDESGDSQKQLRRRHAEDVLKRAYKCHRKEASYVLNGSIEFITVKDHILPSVCNHSEGSKCQVCVFERELRLPNLPEMIFAENLLELNVMVSPTVKKSFIKFCAFDALKLVNSSTLPNVKVDASKAWQKALGSVLPKTSSPFDWTYTAEYMGSVADGIRAEETNQEINIDALKRPDPLYFYDVVPLYEDELADNGCAEMSVKVRVMPENYFVLCRFYLRVDRVMVRICDCRIYSEAGWPYALLEFTRREDLYTNIRKEHQKLITDSSQIWQYLPMMSQKRVKLYYPTE